MSLFPLWKHNSLRLWAQLHRNDRHFIFWPHSSQASALNIHKRSHMDVFVSLCQPLSLPLCNKERNYILILVYIKLFLISWVCFKFNTWARAAPPAVSWERPVFSFFNNYFQYIGVNSNKQFQNISSTILHSSKRINAIVSNWTVIELIVSCDHLKALAPIPVTY